MSQGSWHRLIEWADQRRPSGVNPVNSEMKSGTVEVTDLRIRYDESEVVRGISLSVGSGEIVSLLGPSGCGKTTTLRAIAGFVTPDHGDVRLDGQSVVDVPPHRRNVGMVFQGYALFPHLSVFDNIAYGLRMRKVARTEIGERVKRVLSLVKLTDYAGRQPKQLSGGQQQRVAIARALVIEPKVLLLDEPLSNLDARLRQEMRVEMRRLLKSIDCASIFVTHDQEEAMVISDRIVLMNGGVIAQEGSPREIYQHPCNLFAAAFVGQANFLHGTAKEVSHTGEIAVAVDKLRFEGIACGDIECGAPVTLVVRHERVHLAPQGTPGSDNTVDCALEGVSFIGANIQMHCIFGNQRIVSLMPAAIQGTASLDPGTPMRLTWDRADALVFASEPAS